MGQILVGGATAQFPALRHVFFVGDILTTRDCKALRKLGGLIIILYRLFRQVNTNKCKPMFLLYACTARLKLVGP